MTDPAPFSHVEVLLRSYPQEVALMELPALPKVFTFSPRSLSAFSYFEFRFVFEMESERRSAALQEHRCRDLDPDFPF